MKIKTYSIGDLVRYTFRTSSGEEKKVGLITGRSAALGANVWCVTALSGEEYRIHGEYLERLQGEKRK